ncbi:MAG: DUF4920 domain-containing protein [Chlorobi bacterium]|nr:DUF4920 domain-containing protein [Chlorobiota bacterium]
MIQRMIFLLPLLAFGFSVLVTAQEVDEVSILYGEELDTTMRISHGVSGVVTDTTLHNTTIKVYGTILDVCQKKGCWMVISDGQSQMRITFKDYGFFVPTDCGGKQARVQGVVSVEEIPEDLAKHYAEESESEDPDAISGPQRVATMVATGVRIEEIE